VNKYSCDTTIHTVTLSHTHTITHTHYHTHYHTITHTHTLSHTLSHYHTHYHLADKDKIIETKARLIDAIKILVT